MHLVAFVAWVAMGALASPLANNAWPGEPPPARGAVNAEKNPDTASTSAPSAGSTSSAASSTAAPSLTFSSSKAATPRPPGPDCTSTLHFLNPLAGGKTTHGPVKTVWASTVTTTEHRDCAGCRFLSIDSVHAGGHGPVVVFTTTTTLDAATPSTAVAYACRKTPSVQTNGPPSTLSPSPPPALPTPTGAAMRAG
ncbi:hypothetical protein SPI_00130 [Niveomyces insectorum RCEF 264]|uniref:Uncharacterized protein n=1 Tax=Niveomyces insectorum RCEF 264 TaxID=1081102 RepID=A0A167ZUX2_9HYPO|nr:hypothetical protein SPI_00130 [Niveomyces insectorum RCEF 264]